MEKRYYFQRKHARKCYNCGAEINPHGVAAYRDNKGLIYHLGEKHICPDDIELLTEEQRALADSPEGKTMQRDIFEYIVNNRRDYTYGGGRPFKATDAPQVRNHFAGGRASTTPPLYRICINRLKEHGLVKMGGSRTIYISNRYYKITEKGWERWKDRNK